MFDPAAIVEVRSRQLFECWPAHEILVIVHEKPSSSPRSLRAAGCHLPLLSALTYRFSGAVLKYLNMAGQIQPSIGGSSSR
jgi:hypothetical protein